MPVHVRPSSRCLPVHTRGRTAGSGRCRCRSSTRRARCRACCSSTGCSLSRPGAPRGHTERERARERDSGDVEGQAMPRRGDVAMDEQARLARERARRRDGGPGQRRSLRAGRRSSAQRPPTATAPVTSTADAHENRGAYLGGVGRCSRRNRPCSSSVATDASRCSVATGVPRSPGHSTWRGGSRCPQDSSEPGGGGGPGHRSRWIAGEIAARARGPARARNGAQ